METLPGMVHAYESCTLPAWQGEGTVRSSHEPVFGTLTVFYTYAFDIGRDDHHKFVQRILKAGLAETAVAASDGDILLSPRYRELLKLRNRALTIRNVQEYFDGTRKFRNLGLKSALLLGVTMVRHMPPILLGRTETTPEEPDACSQVDDETSSGPGGESVAKYIEDAVADIRVVAGLQHAVDRDLYRPNYLMRNPYYRLHLRSPRFRARIGEIDLHDTPESVDTTLLVHSSGIALLTFVLSYPAGANQQRIGLLNRSDEVLITDLDLSESVAVGYAKALGGRRKNLAGTWTAELEAGERRILLRPDEKATISDLYNIYAAALGRHHGEPVSGEWMCLTTMIAVAGRCCPSRDRWIGEHESDLASVLGRVTGPITRTEFGEFDLLDDFSIRENAALYYISQVVSSLK